MSEVITAIVDFEKHPLKSKDFRAQCKQKLDANGVLVLSKLLLPSAIQALIQEANANEHLAYYCENNHNVYLKSENESLACDHPRNQIVSSSKGCITDDQVPRDSSLRALYSATEFQNFLCAVLDENTLYKYDDNLSSINVHYAHEGQELGWHFDNSSFAITLLLQASKEGGVFQYASNLRNTSSNEMNFDGVEAVLNDKTPVKTLHMEEGTLVLFKGLNSLHRVTPTIGNRTRILVVLAYNNKAGVSLSETARMTFFGRLS